ncbi:MAG: ion transporter [Tannerella sp.]|jgi:hypothetical protein|nr:ion transporter [Tannerella sp.]
MTKKNILLNSNFILVLIFINAIIIFIQEFNDAPRFFYYADNTFTIIFSLEIFLKIKTFGFKDFWKRKWNKFDFVIISAALLSLIYNSGMGEIPRL